MGKPARPSIQRKLDSVFFWTTVACAAIICALLAGFVVSLAIDSRESIGKFGWHFLVSTAWNPVTGDFGAASSIFGTLVSTGIAMLIATPLSFAIAIFLVELAPPGLSKVIGYAIELLAAIPSIIYGMWGMFVLAPFLQRHVQPLLQVKTGVGVLPLFDGPPMGVGMLTAGLILAIMVLPFISAVMRDIFHMIPPVMKESAYGMGATTWEVTRKVMLRYGFRGLVGAGFLGLGRAIGETMAVTFVIGNNHKISASLFSAGNTISSTLANEFTEAQDPLHLSSLVELGLVLLVITLLIQVAAHLWLKRLARSMGTGL